MQEQLLHRHSELLNNIGQMLWCDVGLLCTPCYVVSVKDFIGTSQCIIHLKVEASLQTPQA